MTTRKVQQVEPTSEPTTKKTNKIEEDFEMPEMEKDPNASPYEEVYYIKPVTKDAAYFEITKKSGDQYITNPRKDVNSLGGLLKKVEIGSYTYLGEEKKTFKLHIVVEIGDKKYLYIISSSYTQVGRTIVNCILDINKPIERIHITLTSKDGFTNATVSINGEAAKWKDNSSGPGKYTRQELSKYTPVVLHPKTKKPLPTDYTDLNEFLETELINHLSVILPHEEHRKITPDKSDKVEEPTDESTFGEEDDEPTPTKKIKDEPQDAADFFDGLGEED